MRIMIVDDSRAMRLIVRRTLREAGFGHNEIIEKANGKEALEALRDGSFDLVLSDWNMPEMTGIELLEALNAEDNKARFGFVTSEGSDEIRGRAMSTGALFLVIKPFAAETFQALFRTHAPGAFA